MIPVREYNHWPLEAFDDAPLAKVVQLTEKGETSNIQPEGFIRDLIATTKSGAGNVFDFMITQIA